MTIMSLDRDDLFHPNVFMKLDFQLYLKNEKQVTCYVQDVHCVAWDKSKTL